MFPEEDGDDIEELGDVRLVRAIGGESLQMLEEFRGSGKNIEFRRLFEEEEESKMPDEFEMFGWVDWLCWLDRPDNDKLTKSRSRSEAALDK